MVDTIDFDVPGPIESAKIVAAPAPAAAPDAGGAAGQGGQASGRAAQATAEEETQWMEEQRKDLRQAQAALDSAVNAVRTLEAEIIGNAESQLVTLALEIAGKVLAQDIEGGKYRIEPIVHEAISRIPCRRDIVVRLNPLDLARWQEAGVAPGAAGVKLAADPSVRRAECVVECAEGVVSATVAEGLTRAAEVMQKQE
ncbi:MAG: FliH/SctL family protein [Planctomycetota bacterium]|nr:FliH/SctL family protein [Planctomycetota bacterium]